jgi:Domain of unknown function (DUF4156)
MKPVLVLLTGMGLYACAAAPLNSNATQVRILEGTPDAKCQYIGDATGTQGNFFTGKFTGDGNLQQGALNELKNRAAAMGGNAITLLANRSGQTHGSETNVTTLGNVYKCKF